MPVIVDGAYNWLVEIQGIIRPKGSPDFQFQPQTFSKGCKHVQDNLANSLNLLRNKSPLVSGSVTWLEKFWTKIKERDIERLTSKTPIKVLNRAFNDQDLNHTRQYYMSYFVQIFQSVCNNARQLSQQDAGQIQQQLVLLKGFLNEFEIKMLNEPCFKDLKNRPSLDGYKVTLEKIKDSAEERYEIKQLDFVSSCTDMVLASNELVTGTDASQVKELMLAKAALENEVEGLKKIQASLKTRIEKQEATLAVQEDSLNLMVERLRNLEEQLDRARQQQHKSEAGLERAIMLNTKLAEVVKGNIASLKPA